MCHNYHGETIQLWKGPPFIISWSVRFQPSRPFTTLTCATSQSFCLYIFSRDLRLRTSLVHKATVLSPDAKLPFVSGFGPTILSFPVLELFSPYSFFLCQEYSSPNCSDRIGKTETIWFHTVLVRTLNSLDCLYVNFKFSIWFFSQFNCRSAPWYHYASYHQFKTLIHRMLLALFPVLNSVLK